MIGLFKIFDAHVHFYTGTYFKYLIRQKPNRSDISTELRSMATKGHIEVPGDDPVQLAKRWVDMIDKWKLERLMLFSSIPGDEESIVKAVQAYPNRFSGMFTIDPNSNLMMETAARRLKEDNMRGVVLYPSFSQISVSDEWLLPLYNLLQECRGLMFIHFGKLIVRPREFAGMATVTNATFSNPGDLIPVAKKFSGIRFIIPNFGAGRFEETLALGKECPNVFIDTAGSNSWIRDDPSKLDLRQVFQKSLAAFGSGRILFGSDSGLLPRGYRYDIVDNQLKLLQEMRIPIGDIKKIFYENMAGLLN
jgi:predicted TIM-barrel fold metal-dependent hydrolase